LVYGGEGCVDEPPVRPNAKRLAPSRVSGEARRARTAPRLFWVIPHCSPVLVRYGAVPIGTLFGLRRRRIAIATLIQNSDDVRPHQSSTACLCIALKTLNVFSDG